MAMQSPPLNRAILVYKCMNRAGGSWLEAAQVWPACSGDCPPTPCGASPLESASGTSAPTCNTFHSRCGCGCPRGDTCCMQPSEPAGVSMHCDKKQRLLSRPSWHGAHLQAWVNCRRSSLDRASAACIMASVCSAIDETETLLRTKAPPAARSSSPAN